MEATTSIIPTPNESDDEDVHWALSTASALWARGEQAEALKWLRRAAEQASDANADGRALELFKAAADVAAKIGPTPSAPPPRASAAPPRSPSTPAPPAVGTRPPPAPGSRPPPLPSRPPPLPSNRPSAVPNRASAQPSAPNRASHAGPPAPASSGRASAAPPEARTSAAPTGTRPPPGPASPPLTPPPGRVKIGETAPSRPVSPFRPAPSAPSSDARRAARSTSAPPPSKSSPSAVAATRPRTAGAQRRGPFSDLLHQDDEVTVRKDLAAIALDDARAADERTGDDLDEATQVLPNRLHAAVLGSEEKTADGTESPASSQPALNANDRVTLADVTPDALIAASQAHAPPSQRTAAVAAVRVVVIPTGIQGQARVRVLRSDESVPAGGVVAVLVAASERDSEALAHAFSISVRPE